jgi:lipopolysaccharide/colanic/teichoic acid biosynthesis glycosyltransferase
MYRAGGKRALDVVFAGAALLLLLPFMLLVAIAIRFEDGGSVIFAQRRVGRGGSDFRLLKFRSMAENVGDVPSHAAAALHITRVGGVIRRFAIDELPQLINILRGDMSLVGPRPALPSQQELVALRAKNGAIACTPGLTGLAQINAYDGMPVAEKAAWDAEYAADVRLAGDLRIIFGTVRYLHRPPPVY